MIAGDIRWLQQSNYSIKVFFVAASDWLKILPVVNYKWPSAKRMAKSFLKFR